MSARLEELTLGADPAAWAAAGLAVEEDRTRIGATPLRFVRSAGTAEGIAGWKLSGVRGDRFDGLVTERVEATPVPGPAPQHALGAVAVDHLVVFSPELERTIGAFEREGVECRRVREVGPAERRLRQAFFRFGEVICEVVEVPAAQVGPGGTARFWGLTVTVTDLDAAAAGLGDRCGTIRDAVQPGRRIATVREAAGLGLPVALISPKPPRRDAGPG